MACIHPSENPPLGWLIPCLSVGDLEASIDFYAKLDLVQFGGDTAEGWAMLRNGAVEVHLFKDHIKKDTLNFRGGDLELVSAALKERGLAPAGEEGFQSRTYLDPDGRPVFFDADAGERERYAAGDILTIPIAGDDVHEGKGMDLGNLTCCLNCGDLEATMGFYVTMGMATTGVMPGGGWAILTRPDHPPEFGTRLITTSLSVFAGMIPEDMLNLRGGNVGSIARVIEERGVDLLDGVQVAADGGESMLIRDPDGRAVLFDTTPPERLYS